MKECRKLADTISLEDAIGQTLMPTDRGYSQDELRRMIRESHLGSFFVRDYYTDSRERLISLRNEQLIPLIFTADMEYDRGMNHGIFPTQMAAAATGDPEKVRRRAYMIGREARAIGVDWLFHPVLDINGNPASPEMNVRTFGDDPELVKNMALAHFAGLRDAGIAATGKHFPGAGLDDRDQHNCTSVNPLDVDTWMKTFGKVWKAAIASGMETVMPGHIAFPAWCGCSEFEALPATIEPKLLIDLLRKELGFDGLIVSDAASMGGLTSRCRSEDCAVEFLRAGGDVFLFADPVKDFQSILRAVRSGYLSEERVHDAAGRMLQLKEKLQIGKRPSFEPLSDQEYAEHDREFESIAEASATVIRGPEEFPVNLKKGDRVLTVSIRYPGSAESRSPDLPLIDELLRNEGFAVEHLVNPPHNELREKSETAQAVFVNVMIFPHSLLGNLRMVGPMILAFWRSFYVGRKNCIFTSFGSPYLLHEQPHWPNLLALYSPSPASQRAAVKVWLGKIKAKGKLPVDLAGKVSSSIHF